MSGAQFPPLPARPPASRPLKPQPPPPPTPWWVMYTPVAPAPAPANSSACHLDGSDNPYVHASPIPAPSSVKSSVGTVLLALGRCGTKLEDRTRKVGNAAGNVWHHLRAGPSLTDAAMSRLTQGAKAFVEGGHDKVFEQIFAILPGERLQKAYACYLFTSIGPVIGMLYISTKRLTFCSDNPLYHHFNTAEHEQNYYQVVVPLGQLRAVNQSANSLKPSESYIQVVTSDEHEFWFMGFVSYDKAFKNLLDALCQSGAQYSQKPHN